MSLIVLVACDRQRNGEEQIALPKSASIVVDGDQAPVAAAPSDKPVDPKHLEAMLAVFPTADRESGDFLGEPDGSQSADHRMTSPIYVIGDEDHPVLVTKTEPAPNTEDWICHACAGVFSAYYLERDEAGKLRVVRRFPSFLEDGSWGLVPKTTPIELGNGVSAIRTDGGFGNQGCAVSWMNVFAFVESGPTMVLENAITAGANDQFGARRNVQARLIEPPAAGTDLQMRYTGTIGDAPSQKIIDVVVSYTLIDGKLVRTDGEAPDLSC
jgi:hypothetical protein